MILSVPFLATDLAQLDRALVDRGCGVEASLFDAADVMDAGRWALVRRNLAAAADEAPEYLTFHFPVNDADWVTDPAVRRRLLEAVTYVADLGFQGVVLHSNRIAGIETWRARELAVERSLLGEAVAALRRELKGSETWIGLENMPVTGNDAIDLDPLLVYPEDFADLCQGLVGITWDVCHYSYTAHIGELLAAGTLDHPRSDYPNLREPQPGDSEQRLVPDAVVPHLKHAHLAAFTGVADRRTAILCEEGQLPDDGNLPARRYRDALLDLRAAGTPAVTLEIQEADYTCRSQARIMLDWCEAVLGDAG